MKRKHRTDVSNIPAVSAPDIYAHLTGIEKAGLAGAFSVEFIRMIIGASQDRQQEQIQHQQYRTFQQARWKTCCGYRTSFECRMSTGYARVRLSRNFIRACRCCGCECHRPHDEAWMRCCGYADAALCVEQMGYERSPQWFNPLQRHREQHVKNERCLCGCHEFTRWITDGSNG